MKYRNRFGFIFLVIFILLQIFTMQSIYAQTKELLSVDIYKLAVEKLSKLGIISSKDYLKPSSYVTRQEFVRTIAKISNVKEKILNLREFSYCIDVRPSTELCGYVNWAISNKYLTISANGKFRPSEAITFSQAITALIRMLNYNDLDL